MVGQKIGSYKVLRQIGAGGCGVVFEAVHEQLGKRAALKLLHADLASDPEIATRFLNEARAISSVDHPGVVNILELGHQPDGATYIVMELLQGKPLTARLGTLNYIDALRLCRQIAATLQAAHDKGIVHRDLKPDNVMIIPDAETKGGERVKVLDFGIAKLTDGYDGPGARALKTRTGMTMGTPVYMSPEQCRGARSIDGKSDVYSLGVMLYEMLAGRVPFMAKGDGEIMAMHIYKEPVPLREINPALPEPAVALVYAMLEKKPEQRPTMQGVAERLEQLAGAKGHHDSLDDPLHTRRVLETGSTLHAVDTPVPGQTKAEVRAFAPPVNGSGGGDEIPDEAPTRMEVPALPALHREQKGAAPDAAGRAPGNTALSTQRLGRLPFILLAGAMLIGAMFLGWLSAHIGDRAAPAPVTQETVAPPPVAPPQVPDQPPAASTTTTTTEPGAAPAAALRPAPPAPRIRPKRPVRPRREDALIVE